MKIAFAGYVIESPSHSTPREIAQHCRAELDRLALEDPDAAAALAGAIDSIVFEFSECLGIPLDVPPPGTEAPPAGDEPEPEPKRSRKKKVKEELVHA